MSTDETQSQDSTAIIITGDDTEVIDNTPGWEESSTEYDRCGEPAGHSYVRYPVCGAEVLDDETLMASHRPTCHYE